VRYDIYIYIHIYIYIFIYVIRRLKVKKGERAIIPTKFLNVYAVGTKNILAGSSSKKPPLPK
jgi:hypothetical protein